MRGELPLEVEDLEDEVSGLDVRLEKFKLNLMDLKMRSRKNSTKLKNLKH